MSGFGSWTAGMDGMARAQSFNKTSAAEATQKLISNLIFEESKSVRTSTIILAAFNVLAAFATAASIIYDCYLASKRQSPSGKAKKFCISAVHPAETFPLVQALAIVIQGLIFAGVQGTGLTAFIEPGCRRLSQIMLPAMFLVAYVQVVFGIECTIRSLRKTPFRARGKYDVTICLFVVFVLEILTWALAFVDKMGDFCFASLVWFVVHYGKFGTIVVSSIIGVSVICGLIIWNRLSTVPTIDKHQRIAASRMVYYLWLGAIVLAFVFPYFLVLVIHKSALKPAMIATVVLNLSGLLTGVTQLILRANTSQTAFMPKGTPGWEPKKREIRLWGPNDLGFDAHMLRPIGGPSSPRTITSRSSLVMFEKDSDFRVSGESMRSPKGKSRTTKPLPQLRSQQDEPRLPPTAITSPTRRQKPKSPYSVFPAELGSPTGVLLPATTYSGNPSNLQRAPVPTQSLDAVVQSRSPPSYGLNTLELPPPIRGPGHQRNSSVESSATVQIGLRLSNMPEQRSPTYHQRLISPTTQIRPLPPRQAEFSPPQRVSASNPPPADFSAPQRMMASSPPPVDYSPAQRLRSSQRSNSMMPTSPPLVPFTQPPANRRYTANTDLTSPSFPRASSPPARFPFNFLQPKAQRQSSAPNPHASVASSRYSSDAAPLHLTPAVYDPFKPASPKKPGNASSPKTATTSTNRPCPDSPTHPSNPSGTKRPTPPGTPCPDSPTSPDPALFPPPLRVGSVTPENSKPVTSSLVASSLRMGLISVPENKPVASPLRVPPPMVPARPARFKKAKKAEKAEAKPVGPSPLSNAKSASASTPHPPPPPPPTTRPRIGTMRSSGLASPSRMRSPSIMTSPSPVMSPQRMTSPPGMMSPPTRTMSPPMMSPPPMGKGTWI